MTPDASPSAAARYLDAQCVVCGWKDGIRADYWKPGRDFWCDECNCEQEFKLCAAAIHQDAPPAAARAAAIAGNGEGGSSGRPGPLAAPGVALDGNGEASSSPADVPAIAIPEGLADYPGAKGGEGVYHTIISQMPPHEVYIEPFVGSGAVLRFKRPAACSIAVDADAMVIGYWQRSERARRPDRRDASPTFICGDGIRFLAEYPWKGGELVYCDPPYLMETRSCQRDYYRKEFTDEDHKRLLAVLVELPCPVLLSGYWSTLYISGPVIASGNGSSAKSCAGKKCFRKCRRSNVRR